MFSCRKTRKSLSSRCSRQRNRRTAATTIVEWRAEASKVRRRRRLGVIYVMRHLDHVVGLVLKTWGKVVQLNRKYARLTAHFHDNTSHKTFTLWLEYHLQYKRFAARIRHLMKMIQYRSTVRGIQGWRELCRSRGRLKKQTAAALSMNRADMLSNYFSAWRIAAMQVRKLLHNNGEASRALLYLLQRACYPVFVAWRKVVRQHRSQLELSFSGSPNRRAPPRKDQLTARVMRWKHVAAWQLMSTMLARTNVPLGLDIEEIKPIFLRWAAHAVHRSHMRQKEHTMQHRRLHANVSSAFCAWKDLAAINRHLFVQKAQVSEVWRRRWLRIALQSWYNIMFGQRAWHRLMTVLATRLRMRELSLMLCALCALEAAAVSFRMALTQSEQHIRVSECTLLFDVDVLSRHYRFVAYFAADSTHQSLNAVI